MEGLFEGEDVGKRLRVGFLLRFVWICLLGEAVL